MNDGTGWEAVVAFVLASLIETAKLNDVDPQAYITDVITHIVGGHPRAGSMSSCRRFIGQPPTRLRSTWGVRGS
jgi:hypothetical protein